MADTSKRPRSDSITSGPDSKRPNISDESERTETTQNPTAVRPAPRAARPPLPDKTKAMFGQESLSKTGANSLPPAPQPAAAQASNDADASKTTYITIRALIVTQDASVIIGKAGAHIRDIRENSGSKVSVSEAIRGCAERILFVSGPLDAVSKGYGLVVRRINDEPFDQPSLPGSKAVTVRFVIPNSQIGMVIGKGGAKIREIQEASGARLQASDAMLPDSTDRLLTVSGVADAVHIAIYYVGTILLDYNSLATDNRQYRPMATRPPPSGRDSYAPSLPLRGRDEPSSSRGGYAVDSYQPGGGRSASSSIPPRGPPQVWSTTGNQPGAQMQQLFIPEELVSSIIGPKGRSINEIRAASATTIKIMEPHEQSQQEARGQPGERLVTITGHPNNLHIAVQMLYARLEEEKQRSVASASYR